MSAALPAWRSVLAVVAHSDDESFGLGALLCAFVDGGATVSGLCFTRGEASTLHGVDGDLAQIRASELRAAADELGIRHVELRSHPDGALGGVDLTTLVDDVTRSLGAVDADGLIAFDPDGVTGHPDHRRATEAALAAAGPRGLPVLGWTVPASVATALNGECGTAFRGHDPVDVDVVVAVDRSRQSRALACHPSQAVPGSVLWRRLELTADREYLRQLSETDAGLPLIPTGTQSATADEGQGT